MSLISGTIDENFVTRLLDQVPNIEKLYLQGNLCYLNFDNFVNLRVLSLYGTLNKSFNLNLELLTKNLCKQLEVINISLFVIDEQTLFKLFDGYKFPYLQDLTIQFIDMSRLKREFISRLPTHRNLNISNCKIEVIEHDSFSNMQHLTSLDFSRNRIELIEENAFSNLKNLQKLDLRLKTIDKKFIGLKNSVEVIIKNFN